jgi:hypothetical protein
MKEFKVDPMIEDMEEMDELFEIHRDTDEYDNECSRSIDCID